MIFRVLITGASGRIAYSLIPLIGLGHAFGPKQTVHLVLFDLESKLTAMEGVKMEIEDSNFKFIESVTVSTDPKEAFKDAFIVIFLGSFPRKEGMTRGDLLQKNKKIFKEQAKYLTDYSKKDVKVLVVGNPANTNALILSSFASSIPAKNITSLMRLDHNRLVSMICRIAKCSTADIKNVVVWGNHSNTQYPSVEHLIFKGSARSLIEVLTPEVVEKQIVPTVKSRGSEVIKSLGASSSLSASISICQHLSDWFLGTGEFFVSMGVSSNGCYNIPQGLIFGLPVRCLGNFEYEIVDNLELSEDLKIKIDASVKELVDERISALAE